MSIHTRLVCGLGSPSSGLGIMGVEVETRVCLALLQEGCALPVNYKGQTRPKPKAVCIKTSQRHAEDEAARFCSEGAGENGGLSTQDRLVILLGLCSWKEGEAARRKKHRLAHTHAERQLGSLTVDRVRTILGVSSRVFRRCFFLPNL